MLLFQEYLFNTIQNDRTVRTGNDEVASRLQTVDATSEEGRKAIYRYLETFGGHGRRPNVHVLSGLAMNPTLPVDAAQRLASLRDISLSEALLSGNNIRGTELERVSFTDLCMCNLEQAFPEWAKQSMEDYMDGYVSLHEKLAQDVNVNAQVSSRGLQTYQYFLEDYRYFFLASTTSVGFEPLLPIALGEHGHKCLDVRDEAAARKKIVQMHSEKLGEWYSQQNRSEPVPGSWVVRVLGWEV